MKYKDAGVDVQAGQEEVGLIKKMVESTHSKEVLSEIGGFSGLYEIDLEKYKKPVLVSGTDGVGTKVILAQMQDMHSTVGIDCVAMCANDILCQGAEPIFFLDYIGTGKLNPQKMAQIVEGVTEGCKMTGASLIGGETAEMPGLYSEEEYDLAGFCVGIVERDEIITGEKIQEGDLIFGLSSSGIHSNGYSLVRKIFLEEEKMSLNERLDGFEENLGQVLLTPTKIYVKDLLPLMKKIEIRGMSHITGGGFYENIPRMMPQGLSAEIDVREVKRPKIFDAIREYGKMDLKDMYSTFNMGIGLVFVVKEGDGDLVFDHFKGRETQVYQLGKVVKGGGGLELTY